jgi:hypothetical protein
MPIPGTGYREKVWFLIFNAHFQNKTKKKRYDKFGERLKVLKREASGENFHRPFSLETIKYELCLGLYIIDYRCDDEEKNY